MKDKHILISAYAFHPSVGGLEQQSLLLAKEWQKMGHKVEVLTEKESPDQPAHELYQDITIHRIPYVKGRTALDHVKILFHLSVFIITHRRRYSFAMLRAAITLYPLIFSFWKFFKVITYPTYVTADTGGENDEVILVKKLPLYPLLQPIYTSHDYYNSICTANVAHYKEIKIPFAKLTQIPNGIELSTTRTKPPTQIKTFLFLGRLFPYKGIRELLEAFRRISLTDPSTRLVIGGVGPEEVFIRNFIQIHSLHNSITLAGLITDDMRTAFFAQGDCLVLPSYSEGFPLTVLEAMLHNRAIITSDVSDLKKLFSDVITICHKKDVQSLYNSMCLVQKTYEADTTKYDQYLKNYDITKVADQIAALCLKLD